MYGNTEKPSIDFEKLCRIGNYEVPKDYKDMINVLIVDECTAIPYMLITSEDNKDDGRNRTRKLKNLIF